MNAIVRPNYASSWIFTPTDEEVKERIQRLTIARGIPRNWLHDVARAIARLDGRTKTTSRDVAEAVHYWPPDQWRQLAQGKGAAAERARKVLEQYQHPAQMTLFNPGFYNYFLEAAREFGREAAHEFRELPIKEYIRYKFDSWLPTTGLWDAWQYLNDRERAGWRRQWEAAYRSAFRAERRRLEHPSLFNPARVETAWGKAYAVRDGRAVVFRGPATYYKRREWQMILTGLDKPAGWLDPDFRLKETGIGTNLYQLWFEFYTGDPNEWGPKRVPVTPPLPLREAKARAAEWALDRIRSWQDYEDLKRKAEEFLRVHNPLPEVTDRALRYRAQNAIEQSERRCIYCGSPSGWIEVDHINGYEEDNAPENLAWACRACNTLKGAVFARAGIGRRTRQFNPRRRRTTSDTKGARTLAEWMEAIMALKGQPSRFTLEQAIAKVRATPAWDRSAFAREIWQRRRERGTDRRVPF